MQCPLFLIKLRWRPRAVAHRRCRAAAASSGLTFRSWTEEKSTHNRSMRWLLILTNGFPHHTVFFFFPSHRRQQHDMAVDLFHVGRNGERDSSVICHWYYKASYSVHVTIIFQSLSEIDWPKKCMRVCVCLVFGRSLPLSILVDWWKRWQRETTEGIREKSQRYSRCVGMLCRAFQHLFY